MGNFRNKLKEQFSQIPNELIFDGDLSDRARFLYCYMASKPEDWDFYLVPMAKEIGYSVDTLRKYIRELVRAGWLTKGEQSNSGGSWGSVEYTLEIEKIEIENTPRRKKPVSEKTRLGKNPVHNNTYDLQIQNNKKSKNKFLPKKGESDLVETVPKRFSPPTLKEVEQYCEERNNNIDPETFIDFYTSKGWIVGRTKMKDWRAAIRTWEKNNGTGSTTATSHKGTNTSQISSRLRNALLDVAYEDHPGKRKIKK